MIPKDKYDTTNIERLKSIEPNEIEQISYRLMEWIQDINWPVAQELMKVLPKFHLQLVPAIHHIFKSEDNIWKLWTLETTHGFS